MHEPDAETDELARTLVDSALAVHRVLGPGYSEACYEAALCVELEARGVPFERQAQIKVLYRARVVGMHRLDLVLGGRVLAELKAVEALTPLHFSQVRGYLSATGLEVGLLINFNVPLIKDGIRRIVATR